MNIGQRIKTRRLELSMSVDELATKIGKNRATVYRYESNDIEDLPISILEPLSKALQTTPGYLMGWEDNEKSFTEESEDEELIILNRNAKKLSPEQQKLLNDVVRQMLKEDFND